MTKYRSIEVDFEIHQMIEMERRSFSETPNVALRRLLKLDESSSAAPTNSSEGTPWSGKGVSLPHGTEVRMEYNSRQYTGQIDFGEWVVEGQRFRTPSAAASRVAVTKDGKHTQLDGWNYWYVKRPGDTDWIALKQLRSPQTSP
ncbi:MAG: hypothetical protein OXO52_09750 [Rhodospirillales bacterium]|nr:hypothetical protein [Rhodospirillales bacterium]MDE0379575.1 hypothetical protein [Rhodospirillales bacterium]